MSAKYYVDLPELFKMIGDCFVFTFIIKGIYCLQNLCDVKSACEDITEHNIDSTAYTYPQFMIKLSKFCKSIGFP